MIIWPNILSQNKWDFIAHFKKLTIPHNNSKAIKAAIIERIHT